MRELMQNITTHTDHVLFSMKWTASTGKIVFLWEQGARHGGPRNYRLQLIDSGARGDSWVEYV